MIELVMEGILVKRKKRGKEEGEGEGGRREREKERKKKKINREKKEILFFIVCLFSLTFFSSFF